MSRLLSRLWEVWPVTLIGLGCLVIVFLFYGCESQSGGRVYLDNGDDLTLCASLLASGMDRVRPERMGVVGATADFASQPADGAAKLSQWLQRDDCQAAIPTRSVPPEAQALIRRLLGPDGLEAMLNEELNAFNAADLRDAILYDKAAESLTADMTDELRRVEALFNYVVRVISPAATSSFDLSLSGYEAALFGRGSAEARAWLFAGLLRQARFDAVILRPAPAEQGGAQSAWWVGVPIPVRGEVYLFDCRLGLPVPAEGSRPETGRILPEPATWSQVVANPDLLTAYRQAAGLEALPIDPARLAAVRVGLIGPRTHWKKSLERIELALTEARGVLLYDPLQQTRAEKGLFKRILEAGGGSWAAEDISVWPYPQQYRAARRPLLERLVAARRRKQVATSSPEQRRLDQRIAPFLGPVKVETEGPRPTVLLSRNLWNTRIELIAGEEGAIAGFLRVRHTASVPDSIAPLLSPRQEAINRQTSDEAYYWGAHAQYRAARYATALDKVNKYIDQDGDRSAEAAALGVLCLAELGRWQEAIDAVADLPPTVPGRARYLWLAHWWQTTSQPTATEPVAAPRP